MTFYVAPVINAVENGTLDLGLLEDTLTVEVKRSKEWYQKLLELVVQDDAGSPVYSESLLAPNNDRSTIWNIPTERLTPFIGKRLSVYYTLGKDASLEKSAVLAFSVKENFGEPLTVDLSAFNYIVFQNASLQNVPPQNLPDYAQRSRTLAQAATYTSSNPGVATVDNTGKVSIIGNTPDAPVTITALNAENATLGSYALSICGIRELSQLSIHPELEVTGAHDVAGLVGLSLPTRDEFMRFQELYGQPHDGLAEYLRLERKGLLGGRDDAGNVTYLDLDEPGVVSAPRSQTGYAVGITQPVEVR